MKNKKILIIILVLAAAGGAVWYFFFKDKKKSQAQAAENFSNTGLKNAVKQPLGTTQIVGVYDNGAPMVLDKSKLTQGQISAIQSGALSLQAAAMGKG